MSRKIEAATGNEIRHQARSPALAR